MPTTVTSKLCFNNDTYTYHSIKNLTCKKIRINDDRRQVLCKRKKVRLNCPQTCGLCCDDNPNYSFVIPTSSDAITCADISDSKLLKKQLCNKYFKQSMVRNECPDACDFCQIKVEIDDDDAIISTTTLLTAAPSSNQSPGDEKSNEQKSDDGDNGTPILNSSAIIGISFGASAAIVGLLFINFKQKKKWKEGVESDSYVEPEEKQLTHKQRLAKLKKSLKLNENQFGKSHVDNAKIHYDIGTLSFKKGDNNNSLRSFTNALHILDIDTVECNPNVAAIHYMMGETYKSQMKYKEATAAYSKALKIHERIEKKSTNVSKLYFKIGEMKHKRGDKDEALKFCRAALHTEAAVSSGDENLNTALIHHRIGMLHHEKDDAAKAYGAYRHALEILSKNLENEFRQRRLKL